MSASEKEGSDSENAMSGLEEAGQSGRHRTYVSDEDKLSLVRLCVLNQDHFRSMKRGKFWENIKALYLQEHRK